MAGRTISDSRRPGRSGVAHGGRTEAGVVLVTGIALRRCRDVGSRLAQCRRPVVAGRTLADGGRVMGESRCRPAAGRAVAGIALRRGADVCRRLDLGIDREVGPAVAGRAVPCRNRARSP